MRLSPNLVLHSYTYVDFNAFDDFDSFKVVSLFVCLLFTRILNNHISRTNTFIMVILKKKEVSNDNVLHITKKAFPSSAICKKPLVDITNITAAGSFQKRSIKKKKHLHFLRCCADCRFMDYVLEFSDADNFFVYQFFLLKIGMTPFPRFTFTYVKFYVIG